MHQARLSPRGSKTNLNPDMTRRMSSYGQPDKNAIMESQSSDEDDDLKGDKPVVNPLSEQ